MSAGGHDTGVPSPWVRRFAGLIPAGAVLDVACGAGRHTRLLLDRGHPVTAVDRDLGQLGALTDDPRVTAVEADLETDAPPSFAGERYAGVVVTNYLHRPLLPQLVACVADGGVLLYETFGVQQPRFGRPTNPDWLLRPGELLAVVAGRLHVAAYEDLIGGDPPAHRQRIAAVAGDGVPRLPGAG